MNSSRAARISAVLTARFAPISLHVQDDSARHAGHAGADAAGETHYSIAMVAEEFAGMSRLARSRAVHAALAAEFSTGLHALALSLRAPGDS